MDGFVRSRQRRVQAAHWLLDCAVTGIDGPDTDARHITVLRRQLTGALDLLGVTAGSSQPHRGTPTTVLDHP